MSSGKRTTTPPNIQEIKITLLGIEPPIWRRIAVQESRSLAVLHDFIQAVMGWKDCHLHMFEVGGRRYSSDYQEMTAEWEARVYNERNLRLRDIAKRGVSRFRYEYDFGDDWQHELEVVKIGPPEPDQEYPICLAGERACPPEDVGGVFGYAEFLEAIADPNHEEHDSYLEWVGGEFDPEAFDLKQTNWLLGNAAHPGWWVGPG